METLGQITLSDSRVHHETATNLGLGRKHKPIVGGGVAFELRIL